VRTERELASRLLRDPGLNVIPVIFRKGSLRALDLDEALRLVEQPAAPAAAKGLWPDVWARPLAKAATLAAKGLLRLAPERSRRELLQSLIHAKNAGYNLVYGVAKVKGNAGPVDPGLIVHPGEDDLLFHCGLGWDLVDLGQLIRLHMRAGLKVVSVIYDLIPILHPNFFPTGDGPYLNYFLHIADISDHVICISECTRRDFDAFCADYGRQPPPTSVVHLGAELSSVADPSEFRGLAARLRKSRFALSVGTFEIRKNYGFLIDLWHELAKDPAFYMDLVIVGARGWCADDIIARLWNSPLRGKRIFWLENVSDPGLAWLYDNCHVFLFPSHYEGWGLPIVEALSRGRKAIISGRGATAEAGFGVATIIDPSDRGAWYRALREMAEQSSYSSIPVSVPSWEDTTACVKKLLLGI